MRFYVLFHLFSTPADIVVRVVVLYICNYRYIYQLIVGWIARVPGDIRHARCRYCCVLLNAHRNDLMKHSRSSKHAVNIAFGRAYSDDELSQQAVSRSVLTASEKKEQLSRKKKSRFSECTRLIMARWVLDSRAVEIGLPPLLAECRKSRPIQFLMFRCLGLLSGTGLCIFPVLLFFNYLLS